MEVLPVVSLSLQQFYIALKTYIPGIFGIPEMGNDGPLLGEQLALREAGNPLYSLLAALRFTVDLKDGRSLSPAELLESKDTSTIEGLKPAELPVACSWFQMDEIHGAIALYPSGEDSYTSEFFLASKDTMHEISHFAKDWKSRCFTNGEALQDYIVEKNLFNGDYMLNFKAGILGAHLFAKLLDQLPMDRKS